MYSQHSVHVDAVSRVVHFNGVNFYRDETQDTSRDDTSKLPSPAAVTAPITRPAAPSLQLAFINQLNTLPRQDLSAALGTDIFLQLYQSVDSKRFNFLVSTVGDVRILFILKCFCSDSRYYFPEKFESLIKDLKSNSDDKDANFIAKVHLVSGEEGKVCVMMENFAYGSVKHFISTKLVGKTIENTSRGIIPIDLSDPEIVAGRDKVFACFAIQILRGLRFFHSIRRHHPNLHTGNILIGGEGNVKLCPLGTISATGSVEKMDFSVIVALRKIFMDLAFGWMEEIFDVDIMKARCQVSSSPRFQDFMNMFFCSEGDEPTIQAVLDHTFLGGLGEIPAIRGTVKTWIDSEPETLKVSKLNAKGVKDSRFYR